LKEDVSVKLLHITASLLLASAFTQAAAQQPAEQRASLTEPAIGVDAKGAPAIEARLLTTALTGSEDSPIANVRLVLKNIGANAYSYVTGWATFYDGSGVRCGEGLFKVDALATGESAETDTPGLRLRCTPAAWRIAPTNLLMRASETAKPIEAEPTPAEPAAAARPAPINFIISIDGEEHPIQVNNPIVLKLGNRQRKIVLRSAP